MTMITSPSVHPELAIAWYDRWLDAWNSHDPERVRPLITEDLVLTTPTSLVMNWDVRGVEDVVRYMAFVVGAYPDLVWERTGPPMYALDAPRVGFTWRGSGTFSGRLDPPGIQGTGLPFAFTGVEVFDFRAERPSALEVSYDLQGLMRQVLPNRRDAG
jgi:SnoaL-like protein